VKKIFHKIGEVCELTKTEPYVLRYWESEFPFLAPEKNSAGQRIYSDDDIEMVLAIKRLLYEEGYTTAGARRRLEKELAERGRPVSLATSEEVAEEALEAERPAPPGPSRVPTQKAGAAQQPVDALRRMRAGLEEIRGILAAPEAPSDRAPNPRAPVVRSRKRR
jgi:DNA-binding transcriptional MerR regulator